MANKLSWSVLVSRENLLARLLRMFYVVPPAVTSAVAAHQRNLMLRFNLPLSRAQRYGERARDSRDNCDNSALPELFSVAENSEEQGQAAGEDSDEADPDPSWAEKLGTGPGEPPLPPAGGRAMVPVKAAAETMEIEFAAAANNLVSFARSGEISDSTQCRKRWDGSIIDLFASNYSCCCDCCRRAPREWLLPRAKASYLLQQCSSKQKVPRLRLLSCGQATKLRVIRERADCELGALSCGYVLKGSGSVKGHQKRRA
jgi:hypothetical protein